MSGIAGIVNLDGAPVDRDLLERMASSVAYRGPDATEIWTRGPTGFVHTSFRTTFEAQRERQPMSLDGEVWITADARIDGRGDLLAELRGHGCTCSPDATDPELILHAYAVWGERSVEHLIGDFTFAIWDHRLRRLFCVRDQLGIKPFFYAQVGGAFLFSNDMDCLRLHPAVPDDLNELWIADFLILASGQNPDRSVIEAIRRLPAAHLLVADASAVRVRRYWTLPVDPPTVYKHPRDYVERFLDLFRQAIDDRLRTNRVSVTMSGGTDSTAVAAVAKQLLSDRGGDFEISAHTAIYERLIRYQEGPYAESAARALGIPWFPYELDSRRLLGFWDQPQLRHPEPEQISIFSHEQGDILGKPPRSRVVLTGLGGDPIFSSLRLRHCRDLLRQGRFVQLASDVARYLMADGRMGRLYFQSHWQEFTRQIPKRRPYPDWLNPDLEKKYNLPDRYNQLQFEMLRGSVPKGVVRPEAYQTLIAPLWRSIFEDYDSFQTRGLVEFRHPFFDLRLARYCLSLPALPWCSDKELLRRAMRGLLPDPVRLRRKATVGTDHLIAHFQEGPKPWWDKFEPVEELSHFVELSRVRPHFDQPKQFEFVVHLRPICLNYWLKWESLFAYNIHKEEPRVHTH